MKRHPSCQPFCASWVFQDLQITQQNPNFNIYFYYTYTLLSTIIDTRFTVRHNWLTENWNDHRVPIARQPVIRQTIVFLWKWYQLFHQLTSFPLGALHYTHILICCIFNIVYHQFHSLINSTILTHSSILAKFCSNQSVTPCLMRRRGSYIKKL